VQYVNGVSRNDYREGQKKSQDKFSRGKGSIFPQTNFFQKMTFFKGKIGAAARSWVCPCDMR